MAEKNGQLETYKFQRMPNVLRAKDIIPGNQETRSSENQEFAIPRFNLAQDIMAEQRRLTAIRRKGPSSILNNQPSILKLTISTEQQCDPIIAEIVARDIKRLCEDRRQ